MRSQIIKFAAAAVIILAFVFGVPFFSTSGPSVTLAGVYEKLQGIDAFMYKMNMVMTSNMQPGMPSGPAEARSTVLVSNEYGMMMDTQMIMSVAGQEINTQMYIFPQEEKAYMILHNMKKYIEMEFNDDSSKRIIKQDNDPRDMVKQILKCQYTELGKSTIDGIEVEGFETTDPSLTNVMMEDVKVILWVDSQTWLPVRVEMNMKMSEEIQVTGVIEDFVWDLQVDASDFEPVIPEDYTTLLPAEINMTSYNEETAIEGLKFISDNTGEYPEELNLTTMTKVSRLFYLSKKT